MRNYNLRGAVSADTVAVPVHVVIMCITSNESIKDQKQLPQPVKVNTDVARVIVARNYERSKASVGCFFWFFLFL